MVLRENLIPTSLSMLDSVRRTEPVRNVFHLHFPTQHLLASTFMRFQEFYESPNFKGKSFSREEFEDWYAAERGAFTYYNDWSGFNVPSRVFTPFRAGTFDPLTTKESWLLHQFENVSGKFYAIGTWGEEISPEVLRHEVGHGLFYTRPAYRRQALEIVRREDTTKLREFLGSQAGYHPDVFDDEVHAYTLASLESLAKHEFLSRAEADALLPAHERLLTLFHRFAPGL